MKKINQQVLVHLPQLWNTKFIPAMLIAILGNVIFWLVGFFKFNYPNSLLENKFIWGSEELFVLPAVLSTLIFLIVWVYFYTQNNAFKQRFRLPDFYLVKEFFLIFVILLTSNLFVLSHYHGFMTSSINATQEIDIAKRMKTANKAMFFLPVNENDYETENDCSPPEVSKSAPKTLFQIMRDRLTDSLRKVHGITKLDDLIIREITVKEYIKRSGAEVKVATQYNYDESEVIEGNDNADRLKFYSYNGYCRNFFNSKNNNRLYYDNEEYSNTTKEEGGFEMGRHGKSLIALKDQGAIENLLINFKKDLFSAGVMHQIHSNTWAAKAVNSRDTWENLQDYLIYNKEYGNYLSDFKGKDYIALNEYDNYLENVAEIKSFGFKNFIDKYVWLGFFMFSLAMVSLLFVFRLTGFKEILLSGVASGLLMLFVAFGAFIINRYNSINHNYDNYGNTDHFYMLAGIVLLLIIIAVGIIAVFAKWSSLKAKIALLLSNYAIVLLVPLLLAVAVAFSEPKVLNFNLWGIEDAYHINPYHYFKQWVEKNHLTLLYLYGVCIIGSLTLYLVQMTKKIAANPEE